MNKIDPHQIINTIDKCLLAIDKFNLEELNAKEREEILNQLTNIEKLALEIKLKTKRSQQQQ